MMRKTIAILALLLAFGSSWALNFEINVTQAPKTYDNASVMLGVIVVNNEISLSADSAVFHYLIKGEEKTFPLGNLDPAARVDKQIDLGRLPAGVYSVDYFITYDFLGENISTQIQRINVQVLPSQEVMMKTYPVVISNMQLTKNIEILKPFDVSFDVNTTIPNVEIEITFEGTTIKSTIPTTGSTSIKEEFTPKNSGGEFLNIAGYVNEDGVRILKETKQVQVYIANPEETKPVEVNIVRPETKSIIISNGSNLFDKFVSDVSCFVSGCNTDISPPIIRDVKYLRELMKTTIVATADDTTTGNSNISICRLGLGQNSYDMVPVNGQYGSPVVQVQYTLDNKDLDRQLEISCFDSNGNIATSSIQIPVVNDTITCNTICDEGYYCSSETKKCEPIQVAKADVLIVTSSKLKTNDEYDKILSDYRKALSDEGLTSLYLVLDSKKTKDIFNIEAPDVSNWASVKSASDKILIKSEAKYLVIVGGVDVIPQPPAKTEAEIPTIPVSDDTYADIDGDGIPDVATGRFASPVGGSLQPITESLKAAIKVHRDKQAVSKVLLADTCIWPPACNGINDVNQISDLVLGASCSDSDNCKPIPPYCSSFLNPACSKKNELFQLVSSKSFIYIDSHGDPFGFMAHAADGNWYDLSDIKNQKLSGAPLIGTVACHSGTIDCAEYGCIDKSGSVFSFLSNGASAYIANTRYGYGVISPQMFAEIFKNIRNGDSVGMAVLHMKRSELPRVAYDSQKAIIYEIQIYGDPTISYIGV